MLPAPELKREVEWAFLVAVLTFLTSAFLIPRYGGRQWLTCACVCVSSVVDVVFLFLS